MDSDFFTDGYADKKELAEVVARLAELQDELHGGYEQTGRPLSYVEEEIERLTKRQDELLLALEHEENKDTK